MTSFQDVSFSNISTNTVSYANSIKEVANVGNALRPYSSTNEINLVQNFFSFPSTNDFDKINRIKVNIFIDGLSTNKPWVEIEKELDEKIGHQPSGQLLARLFNDIIKNNSNADFCSNVSEFLQVDDRQLKKWKELQTPTNVSPTTTTITTSSFSDTDLSDMLDPDIERFDVFDTQFSITCENAHDDRERPNLEKYLPQNFSSTGDATSPFFEVSPSSLAQGGNEWLSSNEESFQTQPEPSGLTDAELKSLVEKTSLSEEITKKFLELIKENRECLNFELMSQSLGNINRRTLLLIYQNNRRLIEKYAGETSTIKASSFSDKSCIPIKNDEWIILQNYFDQKPKKELNKSFDPAFIKAFIEGIKSHGRMWTDVSTYIYKATYFQIDRDKLENLFLRIISKQVNFKPKKDTFKFNEDGTSIRPRKRTNKIEPTNKKRPVKQSKVIQNADAPTDHSPAQKVPTNLQTPILIPDATKKKSLLPPNEEAIKFEICMTGTKDWPAIEASLKTKGIYVSAKKLITFFEKKRSESFSHIKYTPLSVKKRISSETMEELKRVFNAMDPEKDNNPVFKLSDPESNENPIFALMTKYGKSWHEISDHIHNTYEIDIAGYDIRLFYKSLVSNSISLN